MVKVKEEPEIGSTQNATSKPPLTQNSHSMNHNHMLKLCNNQNHFHHHRIYHHYTYYYHYSINQSESDVVPSGTGDNTAPKFYFGPGFEPQISAADGDVAHDQANGSSAKNTEYVVLFHVNPGVTISFQIGDNTEVLRGEYDILFLMKSLNRNLA
ncbi:hypothetical protein HHI36_005816 [Cryptolaemus montrouzieri]|uniref:Uncharacterized protein n=1 Tax=Cryptolaemus montrouzieri TaxID=559131 RepID=A0ABD2NW86_9CUCU